MEEWEEECLSGIKDDVVGWKDGRFGGSVESKE